MAGYGENDSLVEYGGYGENDTPIEGLSKPIEKPTGMARRAADYGLTAIKGAIGVPEAIVGLADLVSGGYAGKALEQLGFRPEEAKSFLDEYYSDSQKEANKNLNDATGFLGKASAAVQNPSTIAHAIVESLPAMGAGGLVGRGLVAGSAKVAPWAAGAIGEGVVGGGLAAEQIRQQTDDGLMTPKQIGAAGASALGAAAFGGVGGKLSQKLGIADVDTMLAGGAAKFSNKAFARKLVEGGISEGAFEEMPQSMQEQLWQNVAMDKPIMEGVPESGAMGLVTGGVMGGVGGGFFGGKSAPTPATPSDILAQPDTDTAIKAFKESVTSTSAPTIPFPSSPYTPSQELADFASQEFDDVTARRESLALPNANQREIDRTEPTTGFLDRGLLALPPASDATGPTLTVDTQGNVTPATADTFKNDMPRILGKRVDEIKDSSLANLAKYDSKAGEMARTEITRRQSEVNNGSIGSEIAEIPAASRQDGNNELPGGVADASLRGDGLPIQSGVLPTPGDIAPFGGTDELVRSPYEGSDVTPVNGQSGEPTMGNPGARTSTNSDDINGKPSFSDYKTRYPEVTHISLISKDRFNTVSPDAMRVGSLEELRPKPSNIQWVKSADSFNTPESIAFGKIADSDISQPDTPPKSTVKQESPAPGMAIEAPAAQTVAQAIKARTQKEAESNAAAYNRNGTDQVAVIPHPTQPGKFAIVPNGAEIASSEPLPAPALAKATDVYGTTSHVRKSEAPKLKTDVPNEYWLNEKRQETIDDGKNEHGIYRHMGKVTGRFDGNVTVPVSVLAIIKGQRGEQRNVRNEDLDYLVKAMAAGKDVGVPYIEVDQDGNPSVSEGNHRIMAAKKLGWKEMPVEIRYFNGGERVVGPLQPDKITNPDAPISVEYSAAPNPTETDKPKDPMTQMAESVAKLAESVDKLVNKDVEAKPAQEAKSETAPIETKETDQGTALYSRNDQPVTNPHTTQSLQPALINAFTGKMRNAISALFEAGKARVVTADLAAMVIGKDALFAKSGQTGTPAFKSWFGDSKVVDADGNPLVVYHGTDQDIEAFDQEKLGFNTNAQSAKKGFFFTTNARAAAVYPVYDQMALYEFGGMIPKYNELLAKAERNAPTKLPIITMNNRLQDLIKQRRALEEEERAGSYSAPTPKANKLQEEEINPLLKNISEAESAHRNSSAYIAMRNDRLSAKDHAENNNIIQRSIAAENEIRSAIEAAYIDGKIDRKERALISHWLDTKYPNIGQSPSIEFSLLSKGARELLPKLEELKKTSIEGRDFAYKMQWSKQAWAGGDQEGETWEAKKDSIAPNIIPAFLSLQNPFVHEQITGYRDKTYSDLIDMAISGGYDGVIIKNSSDPLPMDVFIAFRPNQIKSAIGNNGDFDAGNSDIIFSRDNKYGETGNSLAFFNPADGITYFIADNISKDTTSKELRGLALHELAVHAIHLGKDSAEFQSILNQVEMMRKAGNKQVRDAFNRVPDDTPAKNVPEEALAYLVQNNGDMSIAQKFVAWLRQAIRAIGKSMPVMQRMKFMDGINALSVDDLVYMTHSALANSNEITSSAYSVGEKNGILASRGNVKTTSFWRMMAGDMDLYQNPTPESFDMVESAREIDPGMKVADDKPDLDEEKSGMVKKWYVTMPDKTHAWVYENDNGQVWLNASNLGEGVSGGTKLYLLVGSYAEANGKVFIGDPAGLSDVALLRRTENMLSLALRYGGTHFMEPHEYQMNPEAKQGTVLGGIARPITWVTGDDENNLSELLKTSYTNTINLAPEIKNVTYNFDKQRFEYADGQEFTSGDFDRASKSVAEAYRIGGMRGILERARALSSVLDEGGLAALRVSTDEYLAGKQARNAANPAQAGNGNNARTEGQGTGSPADVQSRRIIGSATLKRAATTNTFSRAARGERGGDLLAQIGRIVPGGLSGTPLQGILYSRKTPDITATDGSAWDAPEPSMLDNFVYRIQNKHIDLKQVQKAIKETSGEIKDAINAYLKEELFHGRAATRIDEFLNNELNPLITVMRMSKVSQEDLGKYLWAKHANEANAHIASINPDNEEMWDGGSGMTDREADDYMDALSPEQRKTFEALAKRVYAMTAKTRQQQLEYGLISQSDKDTLENAYRFYVPLNREDMDTMAHGTGAGQGFSIRGSESKKRTGSKREVVDILGNIANQRDKAVVRGEKNRVVMALYGLAQENPNPDFWKVDKPPVMRVVETIGGVDQVVERVDSLYKSKDNVVMVKIPNPDTGKIEEHSILFNERNERAVRMAASIKNLDGSQLGELLGTTAKVTRYFSAINTQYNPIFGVVNLVRDVQGAMINLTDTPLSGKQGKILADVWKILAGSIKHKMRGFDVDWAKLAEEFAEAGGKTGYRDMFRTGADRSEAIQHALDHDWWTKTAWGKVITANGYLENPATMLIDKGARPLLDWLSDYNETMENTVRLAAYKEAKASGMSIEQSASLAKNLTVNFNRKGEMAMQAGALYAFFNASVQGMTRMASALKGPAGKKIIYGGITIGAMQALLLAAAWFDDDEPPDFVRERNLILPIGDKKYLTLPMPLGFNVLPNIGRLSMELMLSGGQGASKKIESMMGVLVDATNPLGGSSPIAQIISPTITDPIVALGMNKDWTGKPIAREDFNSLNPTPGFTRSKDVSSAPAKWIAEAINTLSGGTKYKQGIASPTADQIEYLIGQVTGGVGREIGKATTTAETMFTGEDFPSHKIPLIGRFYGSTEGQASEGNAFYSNLKELNEHEATIKGLRKDRKGAEAMEYLRDNPEARLFWFANQAERKVGELRKQKRHLIENDAEKERIKLIDMRITGEMKKLNDRLYRLKHPDKNATKLE